MIQYKSEFLSQLDMHLGKHPEKEQIIFEYDTHITEMLEDIMFAEEDIMSELYNRLGSPEEIAASWREELSLTPKKTQWLFIIANLVFFVVGSVLTLVHNVFDFLWIDLVWKSLTSIPSVIILIYLVFWAMLGYEIGKGFGHGGRSLMKKTYALYLAKHTLNESDFI